MEEAYEATAFCGTLFLYLCDVSVWSGAYVWAVFVGARPFFLFKMDLVLSRG